jgi:hypothetical protein
LRFNIEVERETDGRWIAEIPEVLGALAYRAKQFGSDTKGICNCLARLIAKNSVQKYLPELRNKRAQLPKTCKTSVRPIHRQWLVFAPLPPGAQLSHQIVMW